ncbi:MAG: RuBisCO large subunit C-terminal-like domain-containing protein, partial [Thermoproteota archaeon]
ETKEMIKRARLVKEFGGNFVMVDILTVGWSALQTIREECEDLKLAIHAHRAFHAAFTRNPEHGMSMLVVAKLARLIGVDNIHIGTVVGKLESPLQEVKDLYNEMTSQKFRGNELTLDQEWYNIKPTFPVSSGGLHPGIVQEVMKIISSNIIIQVGGGLWGHPMGGRAGAKAIRQAIDAYLSGVDVLEYAKEHKELKVALEKWGVSKPS